MGTYVPPLPVQNFIPTKTVVRANWLNAVDAILQGKVPADGPYVAATVSGQVQVTGPNGYITSYGDLTFALQGPNPSGIPCPTIYLGGAGKTNACLTTDAQVPGLPGIKLIIASGESDDPIQASGDLLLVGGGGALKVGQVSLQGCTSIAGPTGGLTAIWGGNATVGQAGNLYLGGGQVGPTGGGSVHLIMTDTAGGSNVGSVVFRVNSTVLWTITSSGAVFFGSTGAGLPGYVLVSGGPNALPSWAPTTGAGLLYPTTLAEASCVPVIIPANFNYPAGNVLRYGADPTGVLDCTAAFNQATLATLAFSFDAGAVPSVLQKIVVPPGRYLLNGTVYVRKGQLICGAGTGTFLDCSHATGVSFMLGWGNIGGIPAPDPSGQPVAISDMFILGGNGAGVVTFNNIAGAYACNLFMSAPALGINIINSADINLNNLIIDQGLVGISVASSQNVQGDLIKFFLANIDLQWGANCIDSHFTNCHSEYNQVASILFADSVTGITNVSHTDWKFVYNAQANTFIGAIHNRASGTIASFNACTFNNMPGYAYVHGLGTGSILDFDKCIFDGNRTNVVAPYAQSTAAAAVSTTGETIRLKNCTYRNLQCSAGANSPINVFGGIPSVLEIDGGEYSGNLGASLINCSNSGASSIKVQNLVGDATQTLVNNQSAAALVVRNCRDWFGPIITAGGNQYVQVPYQQSNVYQAVLRASNAAGSIKSVAVYIEKDTDGATSYVTTASMIQGLAHGNPAVNFSSIEFNAPGGGATIAASNSGSLAIAWPTSYTTKTIDVQMLM